MAENKGKDRWITVRMEQELFDDLNKRAEAAGMNRSDFVRALAALPIYLDDGDGGVIGEDEEPIQEKLLLTTRSVYSLTVAMDRQKQCLNRAGRELNAIIAHPNGSPNQHLDAAVNAYMEAQRGYEELEKLVAEFIQEPKVDARPRKRASRGKAEAPAHFEEEPAPETHTHKEEVDYPVEELYPFDIRDSGDFS